tara:strand:- start:1207 stop:1884 length:678 start_codon:yes stop_codon:yes gene_type:complete
MKNYKKIFIIIICFFSLVFCLQNSTILIVKYIVSNFAIRDSFFKENNIYNKGTHEGGTYYFAKINDYSQKIKTFNINYIKEKYDIFRNLNPHQSNFKIEYQILKKLENLSNIQQNEKKISSIYISKNLKEYWNMSCDNYMPSFLVPSISNIVMINGLPSRNKVSCYGHELEHGYSDYYQVDKKYIKKDLTNDQLCKIVEDYNLSYVYIIAKQSGIIKDYKINCNK